MINLAPKYLNQNDNLALRENLRNSKSKIFSFAVVNERSLSKQNVFLFFLSLVSFLSLSLSLFLSLSLSSLLFFTLQRIIRFLKCVSRISLLYNILWRRNTETSYFCIIKDTVTVTVWSSYQIQPKLVN